CHVIFFHPKKEKTQRRLELEKRLSSPQTEINVALFIEETLPMTTVAGASPDEKPKPLPPISFPAEITSKALAEAAPWIDHAVEQAFSYKKTAEEKLDAFVEATRSRISDIRSTGSAHLEQTVYSVKCAASELGIYEDLAFTKLNEGVKIAASHPFITTGVTAGLGIVLLKSPRRFIYYKTLRLVSSEEAMLSRADAKVKELRQSISLLKAESEKLERQASVAEGEFIRGRKKLRQTGKQIQGVIRSAYKIDRQAAGLKDVLQELPGREAYRFRSQVKDLASEVKKEKQVLTKEVTKISNYGISV
ncbi:RGS1-HXK1-interacting protein 1, partial [Linum perenne]